MSYAAARWAQAQTLVIGRDPNAILALNVLADAFHDVHGRCLIGSFKDLALSCGFSRSETASAAVDRLSKLGLVHAERLHNRNLILGTNFRLLGYVESEWPATRKGRKVWLEVARSKGIAPQKWWPELSESEETGCDPCETVAVPCQNGYVPDGNGMPYPVKADSVPAQSGIAYPPEADSVPCQNGYDPCETVSRTPSNRAPYPVEAETKKGIIKGIIKKEEIEISSAPANANDTDVCHPLDESTPLEEPHPPQESHPLHETEGVARLLPTDEPPLPFDDVPPLDDPEGLFEPEADLPEADPDAPVIATEAQPGPESEEGTEAKEKPKGKRKASDRGCTIPFATLPDEWRKDADKLAPKLDPDLCWVEFYDYWRGVPGAKGRKAGVEGWRRTWCNHLRKMADWEPKRLLKKQTAQSVLAAKKKEYAGWLTGTS